MFNMHKLYMMDTHENKLKAYPVSGAMSISSYMSLIILLGARG